MKTKKNIVLIIIISFLIIFALLPIFISLGENIEKGNDYSTNTENEFNIYDHDIEFMQNSISITLLDSQIKTTAKVDNVFVNINRFGIQNLIYNQTIDENGCCIVAIPKQDYLLSAVFESNIKLIADIYVECCGRTYIVTTKQINIKSCWDEYC